MSKTTTIWNEEKEQFLKENYAFKTNGNLAKHLGFSVPSVKKKAYELGLKKVCAKRKIHSALEANVLKMSELNSYRSIADKLDISLSSVKSIINKATSKGYKKRSKEATKKIMSEARIRLIKKERARAVFGLNPKTNLKVFPNKQKYRMRDRLKRCRYDVERNDINVYIDDETRRHDNIENEAQKLGFNIITPIKEYYPIDFVFENGEAENQIAEELIRN
ncbi:hypothetical protein O3603_11130 [Prevotella sp. 20925_1_30]|uniref:hypothetical protein n=1 Tax=Prevotella sp. 20925_1_30 TaxID=3003679 RepID=UPI00352F0267